MNNLLSSDSCSRVALTHASMPEQSNAVKHLPSLNTVQDIWLCAVTVDTRGIGAAHANVM